MISIMKSGIELIAEERQRQMDKEGYNLEHDLQHDGGELAIAACVLASPYLTYYKRDYANSFSFEVNSINWDLDVPTAGNVILANNTYGNIRRIKQLKQAGALIAAEIDRINSYNKTQKP
jgi:hypothetical protein